jgi:large subunit ribosomal protein L4
MSVSISVCTPEGKKISDLSVESTGCNVSEASYALAIRVLANNTRSFNSCTKTRGDVSLSGKKPWKQKGTGRARASSAKSPLWRGGGTIFGPSSDRNPRLSLNKKVSKGVFGALFSKVLDDSKVCCLEWKGFDFSTKVAAGFLKKMSADQGSALVFASSLSTPFAMSFKNIPSVRVCTYRDYDVRTLSSKYWIFGKEDESSFKEMVEKWL